MIFKKYSPIGELTSFAAQYCETLYKTCNLSVIVCDRDSVVACAGLPRKEYADKSLSEELESVMEGRSIYVNQANGKKMPPLSDSTGHYVSSAMPIISEGDVIGCVAALADSQHDIAPDSLECKLIQTAAGFLGKQLED